MLGAGTMDSGMSISWEGSQQDEDGRCGVDPAALPVPACLGLQSPKQQGAQEQGQPQTASVRQQLAASPLLARLDPVLEAGSPQQLDEGTSRRAGSAEVEAILAREQAGTTGVPQATAACAPSAVQEEAAGAPAAARGEIAAPGDTCCTNSPTAPQERLAAQEPEVDGKPTVAPGALGGAAGAREPHGGPEKSRVVLLQQALARQLEMQQELQKALQVGAVGLAVHGCVCDLLACRRVQVVAGWWRVACTSGVRKSE